MEENKLSGDGVRTGALEDTVGHLSHLLTPNTGCMQLSRIKLVSVCRGLSTMDSEEELEVGCH